MSDEQQRHRDPSRGRPARGAQQLREGKELRASVANVLNAHIHAPLRRNTEDPRKLDAGTLDQRIQFTGESAPAPGAEQLALARHIPGTRRSAWATIGDHDVKCLAIAGCVVELAQAWSTAR